MNNNSKIAILTQPLGSNYGGILQNYALQVVLKNLGYQPITLDIRKKYNYFGRTPYSNMGFIKKLYHFIINETIYRIVGKRKIFPVKFYYKYIHRHTHNFIKKHIEISNSLYNTQEIEQYFNQENFNGVVVGSDQVWRPMYSPNIYNFFLDFLQKNNKINKISYAASFGTSDWEFDEEQTLRCKDLIKQFNGVSVREIGGVKLCDKYLDTNAINVLDPTLLLQASDYIKLFKHKEKKRNGIFCYVLDKDKDKSQVIESLSKDLKMELFTNQPEEYFYLNKNSNPKKYQIPPVEDWVKSFYEADFVVTDSFHGTVFSILFRKPFLVLINTERGADRFLTILSLLGLENRIYNQDIDLNNYYETIDFDKVDDKLKNLKEQSISFLQEVL